MRGELELTGGLVRARAEILIFARAQNFNCGLHTFGRKFLLYIVFLAQIAFGVPGVHGRPGVGVGQAGVGHGFSSSWGRGKFSYLSCSVES